MIADRDSGLRSAVPLHTTKAEAVAKWMRAQILSGDILPGASLQQEEIARLLDVSSTPVREAFLTLEAEGYVERRPHRGAVVTRPPYNQIEEIREVRNAIERVAVERICAAPEAEFPELLSHLQEAIEESRRAVAANDAERWQRSAFEVHHALALASGSKTLLDVSTMLIARERRNLPVYVEIMLRAHKDHEDLSRALEQRDRVAAIEILNDHDKAFQETVQRARNKDASGKVRRPAY